MAYEISEGAAAAAMFLSQSDYNKLNKGTEAAVVDVMGKMHANLKNVEMSQNERMHYEKWFNPTTLSKTFANKGKDSKLTAVVQGCSAARGIKIWFKTMGHNFNPKPKNVFVTGAEWKPAISFLKMSVGGWDDYNSSDLVIILGKCYYGISLKKKPRKNSANPPMINKSVVKMLTELKQEDLSDEFWNARVGFYGDIIMEQMKPGGALGGSTAIGFDEEDLFLTQIKDPISGKWINLIDLKGEGKLILKSKTINRGKIKYEWTNANKGTFIDGVEATNEDDFKTNETVRKLFAYQIDSTVKSPDYVVQSEWAMRKAVNNALGKQNDLFDKINKVAEGDLAALVGEKLVNAVLKTELKKEFTKLRKEHADKHFGFALVTALGEFKTGSGKNAVGKISSPGRPALVKSDTTIQQTISDLIGAEKKGNWKMQIDRVTTAAKQEAADKEGVGLPAKLFFQVGLKRNGKFFNALDLELRYKGGFSVSPQFLGGISDYFIGILNQKNQSESYKFGEACNG